MVHSDYHKRKALILTYLRNVVTLGFCLSKHQLYGCYDQPLEKRLFNKSRSKSTYRSGRVGEWKKYFDDDIIKIINNNIDGKIEEITRN